MIPLALATPVRLPAHPGRDLKIIKEQRRCSCLKQRHNLMAMALTLEWAGFVGADFGADNVWYRMAVFYVLRSRLLCLVKLVETHLSFRWSHSADRVGCGLCFICRWLGGRFDA